MLKRWLSVNKTSKKRQTSKKNEFNVQEEPYQNMEPLHTIVSIDSSNVNMKTDNDRGEEEKEAKGRDSSFNDDNYFILHSTPSQPNKISNTTIQSRDELVGSDKYETVFDDTIDDEIMENTMHDEELCNNINFTDVTDLMPYGNGSNKIFGYENFGNTCYCNSVLQCLYYLPEFRTSILKYPLRPSSQSIWKQKKEMVGKNPRIFTEQSFERNLNSKVPHRTSRDNNTSFGNDNENENDNIVSSNENKSDRNDSKLSTSGGRKLLSGWLKYSSKSVDQELGKLTKNPSSGEDEEETPILLNVDQKNINEEKENNQAPFVNRPIGPQRYKRIIVGRSLPDKSIVSQNRDHLLQDLEREKSQSLDDLLIQANERSIRLNNEQRKKIALINGPILNIDYSIFNGNKPNLYSALKDIFESITENESLTGVVSPTRFIHILKKENVLFNTMMHQDAHEFLNFLLNDLSEYADSNLEGFQTNNYDSNFIKKLFLGTQSSKIKCLTCDSVTTNNEPFLDFPIEVNENETTDIQKILQDFHQREILNSSNKFYCNVCCGLQEAERVVGIKDLPHVLALHLKRFKYSEEQNTNVKLFNRIDYPLVLNVHSTFDQSSSKQYELIGIVMHMGGGPQHGHYVSLCKTEKFGWLFFDDETVETVEESTVLRFTGEGDNLTTAYVLFYKEIEPNVQSFRLYDEDPNLKKEYQQNVDNLLRYDLMERQKRTQLFNAKQQKIENMNNNNNVEVLNDGEEIHNSSFISQSSGNDIFVSNKSKRSRLFSFMKKSD